MSNCAGCLFLMFNLHKINIKIPFLKIPFSAMPLHSNSSRGRITIIIIKCSSICHNIIHYNQQKKSTHHTIGMILCCQTYRHHAKNIKIHHRADSMPSRAAYTEVISSRLHYHSRSAKVPNDAQPPLATAAT